jgi:hypothetical protein
LGVQIVATPFSACKDNQFLLSTKQNAQKKYYSWVDGWGNDSFP